MILEITGEDKMKEFGHKLGLLFDSGAVIELIGDVGSGKTTLVKGIATGLGIQDNIQSPSFTINRTYLGRDDLKLSHYDFYRLIDAGLMSDELAETINDSKTITIIEWGGIISDILPADRLSIKINTLTEDSRQLEIIAGGQSSTVILEKI